MEGAEPVGLVFQIPDDPFTKKMIADEQKHQRQFDPHPGRTQVVRMLNEHGKTEDQGKNHCGGSDDPVEFMRHDVELFAKDFALWLRFLFRFNMIDKQPDEVKQSRKPGDKTDDVQGFEIKKHVAFFCKIQLPV